MATEPPTPEPSEPPIEAARLSWFQKATLIGSLLLVWILLLGVAIGGGILGELLGGKVGSHIGAGICGGLIMACISRYFLKESGCETGCMTVVGGIGVAGIANVLGGWFFR